ncbi:hypothetical protein [Bradyrhizobium sp. WSM1253]|uniref:hypothetical protein n=1 Tax=Bradyrhizobium sp. WSM1253 TaxID=319003 RepID=UPI00025D1CD4|nr:hypothetical protein [Bradyrhizobium sp. WSM1253]EIG58749.1 hypothetical protein Bra1253DRAFT_03461 [Bradyrhizobium sp. WSM1253]
MTTLKFLSAGFVVAAMIVSPAMAREGNAKRTNVEAYASAQRVPASAKRGCARAPDVGAYATAPWRRPPCEPTSGY